MRLRTEYKDSLHSMKAFKVRQNRTPARREQAFYLSKTLFYGLDFDPFVGGFPLDVQFGRVGKGSFEADAHDFLR